jgi:hypothetical protein
VLLHKNGGQACYQVGDGQALLVNREEVFSAPADPLPLVLSTEVFLVSRVFCARGSAWPLYGMKLLKFPP